MRGFHSARLRVIAAVTVSGGRLDRTTTRAKLSGELSCEAARYTPAPMSSRSVKYFVSRTSPTTWNVCSPVVGVASLVKRVPMGLAPFNISCANASFTMAASGADGVSSVSSKSRPARMGIRSVSK